MAESQWVSLCVGVGSFVMMYTLFKSYNITQGADGIMTDVQRGAPIKRTGQIEIEADV